MSLCDNSELNDLNEIDDSKLQCWKEVGSGGFGKVFKAKHTPWGMDVAVKVLYCNDSTSLEKEAKLMHRANSPNVVRILGRYCGCPPSCKIPLKGLVMEFMEKGSLASLVEELNQSPPWALAVRFAHQVALGMNFLHNLTPQLLHLDLKPQNVLLDPDLNAKITDFGLAKISRSTSQANQDEGGTNSYMPPEAFSLNYKATPASDVYSYAILLWSIVTGKEPYPYAISTLVRQRVPLGDRPDLSLLDPKRDTDLDSLICLIKKCWDNDPNKRPSFHECVQAMEKLLKPQQQIRAAVDEVFRLLDSRQTGIEERFESINISASGPPSCDSKAVPKPGNYDHASAQDRPGNPTIGPKGPAPHPMRALSVDPHVASKGGASPAAGLPSNHDSGRTQQYQSQGFRASPSSPFSDPASRPNRPQGGVVITMSNVTGLQIGNGNHMSIKQCRPRRRNPTAPS